MAGSGNRHGRSGPSPDWDHVDIDVIDAGGQPASVITGGSVYDHETSFAFIRGGHIDATVLGTLQVDQEGNIANWTIPGKFAPGMGGAMDLCAGVKKIIVATDHCEKSGHSKILKKCTLPLTGAHCVTDIVTERCYFEVTPQAWSCGNWHRLYRRRYPGLHGSRLHRLRNHRRHGRMRGGRTKAS